MNALRLSLVFWLTLTLLVLFGGPAVAGEFVTQDGKLVLKTTEEFFKIANPHAILSLQSEDRIVVLVTSQPRKFTLTELYDGLPSTFGDGAVCQGRVLLSVGGEEAATFLVEGMFPPGEDPTHHTLYAVTNRDELEYTVMIHYPEVQGAEGFEWATRLLEQFHWTSPANVHSGIKKN